MSNPIRVLNITRVFKAAGIESFIMNMYRNIDRSKVQFDFLVMSGEESCYDEEIHKLGGRKYTIDIKADNTFIKIQKEAKALYDFLQKHEYKIIHIHYTTPLRAPYLLAAKKAGVPVRIYHSHSAEVSGKSKVKLLVYNYYRNRISKWATAEYACSKAAAYWMFEKKLIDNGTVQIIYNGIDTARFTYNPKIREEMRKNLNLENNFVIAHTGRFLPQKNHHFIIDVFNEVKKREYDAKLLLLGIGELQDEIRQKVNKLGLSNDVYFLGVRKNVEDYLSAADCYIMPSLYEGLPVAAVEAECSGLPCIMSTKITEEVALTSNVVFLHLDDSLKVWAEEVIKTKSTHRRDESEVITQKGYNVKSVAHKLQNQYLNLIKGK